MADNPCTSRSCPSCSSLCGRAIQMNEGKLISIKWQWQAMVKQDFGIEWVVEDLRCTACIER